MTEQVRPVPRNVRELVAAALLVLTAIALAYALLIELRHYVGLLFGSVLLAILLSATARRLNPRGLLPHAGAVAAVALALFALQAGFAIWLGPQLVEQFDQLRERVPEGFEAARAWLADREFGRKILSEVPPFADLVPSARRLLENTTRALTAGASRVAEGLVMLLVGFFFATSPERYLRGAVQLVPPPHRPRARDVLAATAHALRRWLLARAVLMLLIAVLMAAGLLLLGIELALPLALLAGLLSFVPYLGPALALLPALAMGLLKSPMHGLYVVILYMGVQVLESYVVNPLVEARAISLPPALIVIAQVVAATWLGAMGILLASPLLVVVVVAIQMLYLDARLGEDVQVIGNGPPSE